MNAHDHKRNAALRALDFVSDGMRLGLGTGSTAKIFVDLLGERVAAGLNIVAVPTSEATRAQAERLRIPIRELDDLPALDLTIDGADEISPDLTLIKGGGGALLREKIVAAASKRMIVIADGAKWVDTLGAFPLPIEVVAFAIETTRRAVAIACASANAAGNVIIRTSKDGAAFVTDGHHMILDAALGRIPNPADLARRLNAIPGVVEHGLFIGLASAAIIADQDGARVIEPKSRETDS